MLKNSRNPPDIAPNLCQSSLKNLLKSKEQTDRKMNCFSYQNVLVNATMNAEIFCQNQLESKKRMIEIC